MPTTLLYTVNKKKKYFTKPLCMHECMIIYLLVIVIYLRQFTNQLFSDARLFHYDKNIMNSVRKYNFINYEQTN